MSGIPDLASLDSIHEVVASFNISSLSIFFDSQHFPLTDAQSNPTAPWLNLDEVDHWATALDNIPTSILAHELSHAIQTATTPSGLRDFFHLHVAEYHARGAIEDALKVDPHTLPLGLHTVLSETGTHPHSQFYRAGIALQRNLAIRLGGLRFPLDESTAERLEEEGFQGERHPFFVNAEGTSITLLGARHIYEGFGAAAQIIRARRDGEPDPTPDLLNNLYLVCLAQYMQLRPLSDGGTLYEFAVVLDTALLEDQWYNNLDQECRLPGKLFFDLLHVLHQHPDLRLTSMALENVTSFQNQLMLHANFSIPDVGEICNGLHERLPVIFEEIKSISSIPGYILDDYYQCIDTLQRFRIEEFNGACTLELLIFGVKPWLATLISNLPSGTNGVELPLVEGDTERRAAFRYQKAKHASSIFDEIVFGPRRCPVEHACILPMRQACSGVSDKLSPQHERCARESLIADCMSQWHIDHFKEN